MDDNAGNTETHRFFMECHKICTESQFLVDSLPNTQTAAVERACRQLNAIRVILVALHDPHSSAEDLEHLISYRLWRDVRKDTLESYRQIFFYLGDNGLLDMDNDIHRSCLFLVFQPRIQASLDRTRDAWNHHKVRTARNKTPIAMFELSRETAIRRGYWTGDPGDDLATAADPLYGYDGEAPLPPIGDQDGEPSAVAQEPVGIDAEREAGICINDDEELQGVQDLMPDFDFGRDDENWGIDVYCAAVILLTSRIEAL
ncbi:hypothetical protein DFH06DRAFT_1025391 [Mycena polygramma]|nr:hypothetical protein DFH06DRAFT_1025391 [Mycena polygramma]